ncbi:hypothetical protein QAD02_024197 [Eretmocerus hayati]|uniref:Uncharacterized protein n=1 Tax=Eretmocerus hayati TaxID=131215 RepID=A0ACC2PY58_9HYME|nr:hypothetical protein QAD02_024197 [Eretmocerus hayati]
MQSEEMPGDEAAFLTALIVRVMYKASSEDLYQILGCSPTSTSEKLKVAYHRKLLESHPDKNDNSSDNVQKFHDVKKAWNILSDPHLRKSYDIKSQQEQLDAQSAIIFAHITPADLKQTDDQDVLSYQCRCGSYYLVHRTDLQEANAIIHIPCEDCTFVIAIET